MDSHKSGPDASTLGDRNDRVFAQVTEELNEYFNGTRTTFNVALAPVGNAFNILHYSLR